MVDDETQRLANIFIFGLGYSARHLAARLGAAGHRVTGTTRDGRGGSIAFEDEARVRAGLTAATHVVSCVPPGADGDPVLERYRDTFGAKWIAYLSSTGVYGDTGGAWVDESAPIGAGRRQARGTADATWLALGARVFRLPGIYGPKRSALDRIAEGTARRVAVDQLFSRIHVEDIASAVMAAFDAPPGAYNLADELPASQNDVMLFAARLLGADPPPLVSLDRLSGPARGFYSERRRVATTKARRVLGWAPRYPDYRAGLRALSATSRPITVTTSPQMASGVQRSPSKAVESSMAITGTITLE